MVLCRECERLLLRARGACPRCSARRPGARVRAASGAPRLEWLVAAALTAPALVVGELAARWLLRTG